jgi:hypothetical protein
LQVDRTLESISRNVDEEPVGPEGEDDGVDDTTVVVDGLVLEVQRLEEQLRLALRQLG